MKTSNQDSPKQNKKGFELGYDMVFISTEDKMDEFMDK